MTKYLTTGLLAPVLLACAGTAHAQTACPAGTTGATVQSNVAFYLYWCSPATDNVTAANAYGLATTAVPMQSVQQVSGPFSDGLVQMRGVLQVAKGKYTLTVRAVNSAGEGAVSAPFALDAVDPAPTAPIRLRTQ
jgi:hypothetical protein